MLCEGCRHAAYPTRAREPHECRPDCLAGWGKPTLSGARGLRPRSREAGCIEVEARGAKHPGVLYSSLSMQLLAYYSSYEPLSLLRYSATLKLHAVDGSAAFVLAE